MRKVYDALYQIASVCACREVYLLYNFSFFNMYFIKFISFILILIIFLQKKEITFWVKYPDLVLL